MITIDRREQGSGYRFVLSPNCSISWRDLVLFYLFTCVVLLAIGIFFTLAGFLAGVTLFRAGNAGTGIGLYLTSRKVYRQEVITLDAGAHPGRKRRATGRSELGIRDSSVEVDR